MDIDFGLIGSWHLSKQRHLNVHEVFSFQKAYCNLHHDGCEAYMLASQKRRLFVQGFKNNTKSSQT